jgi:histidinol dehydrogenase
MKASIDRIEGPLAVLITQDDDPVTFTLPAAFLGEARDGDIVDITITRDPEGTKAARERVSSLIEKLKRKSGR